MRTLLQLRLAIVLRMLSMQKSRDSGKGVGRSIKPPSDDFGPKQTRYQPAPNNPPHGKRKRQWR